MRQIKLAVRQLLGVRKYSVLYRILGLQPPRTSKGICTEL